MQKRKQVHMRLCENVCRAFDLNMMCLHLFFVTSRLLSVSQVAVVSPVWLHTQSEQTLAFFAPSCLLTVYKKAAQRAWEHDYKWLPGRSCNPTVPCLLATTSYTHVFTFFLYLLHLHWFRSKANGFIKNITRLPSQLLLHVWLRVGFWCCCHVFLCRGILLFNLCITIWILYQFTNIADANLLWIKKFNSNFWESIKCFI